MEVLAQDAGVESSAELARCIVAREDPSEDDLMNDPLHMDIQNQHYM